MNPRYFLALSLLYSPLLAAVSLHQLLQQAWQAQPEFQLHTETEQGFAQRQQQTQQWLADAPKATLEHQTDRPFDDNGQRSWQARLDLPLWQPGQRQSTRTALNREQAAYQQRLQLLHWQLAGRLRASYWAYRLALAEQQRLEQRLTFEQDLQQDTERQIQAGQLSPLEQSLSQSRVQLARLALLTATGAQQQARNRFELDSRQSELPEATETPADPSQYPLDQHPSLLALRAEIDAVQHQRLAQPRLGLNPELQLGLSQQRERAGLDTEHQLAVGLQIPLGQTTSQRERRQALSLEQSRLQQELQQHRFQLQRQREQQQLELTQAQQAVRLSRDAAQLNQQVLTQQRRAFALGELSREQRLAAERQQLDLDAAATQAELERQRRIAEFNQTLGALP